MVLNEEVADFAMGKVIAFEELFVGFAGVVSVRCVDLDVLVAFRFCSASMLPCRTQWP